MGMAATATIMAVRSNIKVARRLGGTWMRALAIGLRHFSVATCATTNVAYTLLSQHLDICSTPKSQPTCHFFSASSIRLYIFSQYSRFQAHCSHSITIFFFHFPFVSWEKLQSNDENVRRTYMYNIQLTLFLHKMYSYWKSECKQSSRMMYASRAFWEAYKATDDGRHWDTCMLCEVSICSTADISQASFWSTFHSLHMAEGTRLSVLTSFLFILAFHVVSFLFLTFSLSFLSFFACSISYFDKNIILSFLSLIG